MRLPPAPGPSGRLESPIRTSIVMRFQSEFVRHRVGDHGAAALADILGRGAGDQAAALDREFDLRAGLPEIEPVAGRDADAAAIAAGLRGGGLAVAPDIEAGRPIIETLAVRIWIPAFAQRDRIDLHPQRRFVDRLFQRKRHRRPAGTAERRAGRQIADDVEIDQLLGLRRIDQARECRERRVGRRAGVGMGGERQRLADRPRGEGSSAIFISAAGR